VLQLIVALLYRQVRTELMHLASFRITSSSSETKESGLSCSHRGVFLRSPHLRMATETIRSGAICAFHQRPSAYLVGMDVHCVPRRGRLCKSLSPERAALPGSFPVCVQHQPGKITPGTILSIPLISSIERRMSRVWVGRGSSNAHVRTCLGTAFSVYVLLL